MPIARKSNHENLTGLVKALLLSPLLNCFELPAHFTTHTNLEGSSLPTFKFLVYYSFSEKPFSDTHLWQSWFLAKCVLQSPRRLRIIANISQCGRAYWVSAWNCLWRWVQKTFFAARDNIFKVCIKADHKSGESPTLVLKYRPWIKISKCISCTIVKSGFTINSVTLSINGAENCKVVSVVLKSFLSRIHFTSIEVTA